ncbi:SapC family protein [Halomonas sp. PR-M31]|uniref:SapC family protein n=1 Tax=Halomonas sp. PR-M31 TaxID=1471202 RepID=UPI0006508CB3|nr:SapC family protein [Halomonas sp. PR-M31]
MDRTVAHQASRSFIHAPPGYGFAATQQLVPILIAELGQLLPHYVLAFVQQNGRFTPVAVTGLGGERNLYLDADGKWLAGYVPAILRGYPFSLANNETDQQVLCIHREHLLEGQGSESSTDTNSKQPLPLFDGQGALSPPVQQTLDFLKKCDANRRITQTASHLLQGNGLIEPWPLEIERANDQEPLTVKALYRVSERALNALKADAFAGLRRHGALPLAYAQLFSMNQLSLLSDRAAFHARKPARAQEVDLEALFDGDNETFSF